MTRKVLIGAVAAVVVASGVFAAGGAGILFQAMFRASGTGAVDRAAMLKLRDVVSVKDFGAVGDGTTDDTAAVSAALTEIATNGGTLHFPRGTYVVGATAFSPVAGVSNVYIRGEGMERTILKAKAPATGAVIDLNTAGAYFQRLEIGDLTIVGGGATGNAAHGIHITTTVGSTVPNQLYIHDVSIRDCGGKGLYVEEDFTSRFVNVMVNNCADNLFDIQGGNTTYMQSTYAQTVNAGFAGYRIHGGNVVMVSANGINNVWGATSPSGLSEDQADWGVFGSELLTAWAQNTAYTLGQLRSANGNEYEVITAGTSDVAGTGPSTISKDITDGTVHWRHVGQADAITLQMSVTLIGCNVEDATRHGIRLKSGGALYFTASGFVPPPAAPAASPGLIALWISFVDPNQRPVLMDGSSQLITNATQYDHGVAFHNTSSASIIRFSGTNTPPSLYSRTNGLISNLPSITTGNAGNSSGTNIFTAIVIDRLKATGAPGAGHVNPTYGANVTIDPNLGWHFNITATNGTAFNVTNPGVGGSSNVGVFSGQRITECIINTSGGALGVATFGVKYKMGAAWAQPATGFRRCIDFEYDGTNWYETYRSAADVTN